MAEYDIYIDEALLQFGINTKTIDDQYRPTYEVMRDVGKLLKHNRKIMTPKNFDIFKLALFETLFGKLYCNEFM